jgi:hypothetical protein
VLKLQKVQGWQLATYLSSLDMVNVPGSGGLHDITNTAWLFLVNMLKAASGKQQLWLWPPQLTVMLAITDIALEMSE